MAMAINSQNSISSLPRMVSIGLVFSFLGAVIGIVQFYAYLHGQSTLLSILPLPISNLACAVLGIPVMVTLFTMVGMLGTIIAEKYRSKTRRR